jgi:hypothetical protein
VKRIRQIDFQTKVFVHASLTRTFAGNLLGSEQYHIIQLNNRSVKDRSFSRKIESERSFFVSESHRVRWISDEFDVFENAGVPMMNSSMDALREAQKAFAGEAEKASLKNDDDVMAMIKELREESVVK